MGDDDDDDDVMFSWRGPQVAHTRVVSLRVEAPRMVLLFISSLAARHVLTIVIVNNMSY